MDTNDLVASIAQLEQLYGTPVDTSLIKVTAQITPLQREYIEASPFVVLASNGPEGVDCSPRGDAPGFVRVVDANTLHLPDRRGNNRLDSLRNIVRDPRVSLLFLVPGIGVTFRVIGRAVLRTSPALRERYAVDGKSPTTVIEVTVEQAYTQCPKALIRSDLWNPERFRQASELPSVGQINEQITEGAFDGAAFDAAYPERIRQTIY
jgi:PPOX class probable FMN-dependent enzyme